MIKTLVSFAFLLTMTVVGVAQQSTIADEPLRMSMFEFHAGFHQPYGDLGELYGPNAHVGISYAYKTKTNILLGADFSFLFGNNVKNQQNMFRELRNSSGGIVGPDGEYITVLIQQRGFTGGFSVGKIWPIFGPNPNSGLLVKVGVHFLEYRTWIETREDEMPHIEGEYRKGYDRKRGGIATSQFVGYQHFSNSRFANFFIGAEIYQGFTTDYRTYNFDEMRITNDDYFDILVGFKVGWVIPIYKQLTNDFFYQ